MIKNAFNGFVFNKTRNRKIKQLMAGIFDRNLEIDFYTAFGKIREEEHIYNRSLIQG